MGLHSPCFPVPVYLFYAYRRKPRLAGWKLRFRFPWKPFKGKGTQAHSLPLDGETDKNNRSSRLYFTLNSLAFLD
jgi:hypothetical protein